MKIGRWKQTASGASIAFLGIVFASVTLFDVYEDYALQADPLYLTLLENAAPIGLDLILVASGVALARRTDVRTAFVARTTTWSFLGALVMLAITLWVYLFQVVQGEIKPHIVFSHVVAMGAVAGLGVGVYDGQRRRREAELEVEHDKISALFDNSSECIAEVEFVDDAPVVRAVNPAFQEVFGYTPGSVEGKSLDDVVVPPGDEQRASAISARAQRGERFEIEELFRLTASGEVRVFRLQAIPFEAASADTDGYAVYTDITAEHRHERRTTALHEATRELVTAGSVEGIADAAVDAATEILDLDFTGIHLYDEDYGELRPVAYSQQVAEVLGTPPTFGPGDAIAWNVFESGTPRYVRDLAASEKAYNEDSTLRSELIVPLDDLGVLMIAARRPGAFEESEYSLAKILGANVAAAMERAERECRLEEQNERLETFTSIVSHDLRNPLNVADGYLELAREGDEAAFDRVDEALQRMDELIEELLTLARQGEAIDEVSEVDLNQTARRAWTNTATADATLHVDGADAIEADPGRLQQLFENLFTNAVDHGGDDVTVRVASIDAGFIVEDDGPGIPQAERQQVFTEGYTTEDDGTGFGLAIVEEIADAHGWTVTVGESDAGGAKFEFSTGCSSA
ncbi:PAS domain S-box protein [Halobellus sp. Atlit-38R]|uniref:sensor histidine kinase n=1 Tax=Halobellus sp. Atlit-38R TaxID=2282131 RepID=UPI000EF1F000|nr:ATP-binding protein [Halobellus sp. Atlit-38R]RLM89648.1 PAS domain S-box protein [Halobellus sp. Atlit-38R]